MQSNLQQFTRTVGLSALMLALPAAAQTFEWTFSVPHDARGPVETYDSTPTGVSITARGYTTSKSALGISVGSTYGSLASGITYDHDTGTITPHNLYGKHDGANETGLGLSGLSSNEIGLKSFIQLDLTDLKVHSFTSFEFQVGSLQPNEGFTVYGGNQIGVPGTALYNWVATSSVEKNYIIQPGDFSKYTYFSVSAQGNGKVSDPNVVILDGTHQSSVPESSSVALLSGAGLLGFAAFRRSLLRR